MLRLLVFSALVVLLTLPGKAQSSPGFDVASVKQVDVTKLGDSISMKIGTVRGNELTFDNVTLNDCVRFAYDLASNAQIDGPDWVRSKKFLYKIDAKSLPNTTREQLQAMMQKLLVERFKLVVRRERKALSHYALVVAKGGSKMVMVREFPPDFQGVTNGGHIDHILPMPMLAYLLSRFETELPIIDQTGLAGAFQVKLDWSLQQVERGVDAEQGPSLFTALQEQLGLKLVHQKGPIDILVIENAEKVPTQN
jgi:uncharacterized protein (TIGR03435 family)